MKISLKIISEILHTKSQKGNSRKQNLDPETIARGLTARGLEVESIQDQAKKYQKITTAKILKKNKHPNADRLNLCVVSTGVSNPELDIVCGAQNMKEGDVVALAEVGAVLPNGTQISRAKIRGVESFGMLCSESELGIKESSEGILILPSTTTVGISFSEAMGLDDVIFEIGVTPNRSDCMSHLGIAREIGAMMGLEVKSWPDFKFGKQAFDVAIAQNVDCRFFYAVLMDGIQIAPSPDWMKQKIIALGLRPINNVVDASNLVLFETGQPLHCYDADKIFQGKSLLTARKANKLEKLQLLDGRALVLQGSEMVIADEKQALGLAGVMGGAFSAVSDSTQRIVIEGAYFEPSSVRQTAKMHGLKTDASMRFERGVDPKGIKRSIERLSSLIQETANGKIVGSAHATNIETKVKSKNSSIWLSVEWLNGFLGTDFLDREVLQILTDLGFHVQKTKSEMKVTPPSWRVDIFGPEDLAEEVARSKGYDEIPTTLPPVTSYPDPRREASFDFMQKVKNQMKGLGFHELVSVSFCHPKELELYGCKSEVKLKNPMSEEASVLVSSLVPGMVKAIEQNLARHFGSDVPNFRFFQLRPTFHSDSTLPTGVREDWRFSGIVTGLSFSQQLKSEEKTLDFSDIKGVLTHFFKSTGLQSGLKFDSIKKMDSAPNWLHQGVGASIRLNNKEIGFFGKLHPVFMKQTRSKKSLWLWDLDYASIAQAHFEWGNQLKFEPLPEFPPMERDFALLVKKEVPIDHILQIGNENGRPLVHSIRVFDIYEGDPVPSGMTSVAVKVIFLDRGKSLVESEIDLVSKQLVSQWQSKLGAQLRGE